MDSQPKGLHKFHQFMVNWKEKTTEYSGQFVSSKLWHDFQSMSLGIKSTIATKQRQFPLPLKNRWLSNEDCMEDHFVGTGHAMDKTVIQPFSLLQKQ